MCQLIFFVYYLFRRPKVARLTAGMFPSVPVEDFLEWQRLELQSIDIFLWGSAVLSVLSFFAGAVIPAAQLMGAQIGFFVAMLLVMIVAAVPGTKSERIRKQHGITV